jgi:hypothetical protein
MTDGVEPEQVSSDLCIVGAGIAGLNALVAATRYLAPGQRVVLVDRNDGAGGMWNSTYDYVRLHQPHAMFTVGDIQWQLGKPRSYLATRREIVAHLRHCLDVVRSRVTIDARFGYEYRSHDEGGPEARDVVVDCASVGSAAPLRIRATRLIKAFGAEIQTNPALPLSSVQVRSVSPDHFDLLGAEMRATTTPVYVVGGGKTGMDTAHALITTYPERKVHLLIGEGTLFSARDLLFPDGLRRYWGGVTPLEAFLDSAKRFNGTNEVEVLEHFYSGYGLSLVERPRRFMFGTMSKRENEVIRTGAREILQDYLEDVVDRDGSPTLVLKRSEGRKVALGTWFVNCTGYVGKNVPEYEPYVSERGKVLSIQGRSCIHVLSTHSAYLLVHLWYRGELSRLPLYELDLGALYPKSRDAFPVTVFCHILYNAGLIFQALPRNTLEEFGIDMMRWYPLPRQLLAAVKLIRYQKRHPDNLRRALDVVRDRFEIRCGPLPHVMRAQA